MVICKCGRFLRNLALGAGLAAATLGAAAQQPYPSRPVRLIVPLAPGGTSDIMGRTMAQQMTAGLGQPVVVENRAGAGGTVGTDIAAKAPPDGYTLLLVSADTYTVNAAMYAKLPYDSRKDLKPISILAASPSLMTVHPSLPVKSVKDLVALSKARPKDLNYGVGGTPGQLRMELLKLNSGLIITHIPYKGSGPALIDLIAGHIDAGFFNLVATLPHVQSGRLRPLLVTGTKRSDKLPEIPTTVELGIKGFEENSGYMIMAPGATPDDITARLHREMVKGVRAPEVVAQLAREGSEVIGNTPEQATAAVNRGLDLWVDVVRRIGIKPQ